MQLQTLQTRHASNNLCTNWFVISFIDRTESTFFFDPFPFLKFSQLSWRCFVAASSFWNLILLFRLFCSFFFFWRVFSLSVSFISSHCTCTHIIMPYHETGSCCCYCGGDLPHESSWAQENTFVTDFKLYPKKPISSLGHQAVACDVLSPYRDDIM